MAKTFEEIDKDRTGPREGGSRTYDKDGNLVSEVRSTSCDQVKKATRESPKSKKKKPADVPAGGSD